MDHAVEAETARCFHTETLLTASHRHASDRGWPIYFPEQMTTRRATSAMFPDNNLQCSHRRSGPSSANDSDGDRLSLHPRRNTLSFHHVQPTPPRQPQSPPLPFRRPSQSSRSSTSSSTSTSTPLHAPSSTSATGRKVAANLQLFKETTLEAPTLSQTDRSRSRPPTSKQETPQIASPNEGEEVGETRFVRRTAWPDREAAAIRRGKSSISLKRAKMRDSDALLSSYDGDTKRETVPDGPVRKERAPSMHDDLIQDLVDWIPETLDRGRAREREHPVMFPSQSSPLTSSISPIRERRSALRPRLGSRRSIQFVAFQEPPPSPSPAPKHTRRGSSATRTSPVLLANRPLTPPPSVAPPPDVPVSPNFESSWSTDDESAWSTTSVASSIATTTSPFLTQDEFPDVSTTPSGTRAYYIPDASTLADEDEAAYGTLDELDPSTAPLPNVPLKPFKNQVGGHSAIYKFTKRAVCKVCTLPIAPRASHCIFAYSSLLCSARLYTAASGLS
jgi:inositol-hexakisphosphate kinase